MIENKWKLYIVCIVNCRRETNIRLLYIKLMSYSFKRALIKSQFCSFWSFIWLYILIYIVYVMLVGTLNLLVYVCLSYYIGLDKPHAFISLCRILHFAKQIMIHTIHITLCFCGKLWAQNDSVWSIIYLFINFYYIIQLTLIFVSIILNFESFTFIFTIKYWNLF